MRRRPEAVAGRVIARGTRAAERRRSRCRAIPYCAAQNPNGATSENYVVTNGGLENVFVYVKDGLGNYYFDAPTDPVKLDQQGCRYRPHVLGVRDRAAARDQQQRRHHAQRPCAAGSEPGVQRRAGAQAHDGHEDVHRTRGDGALQVRRAQLDARVRRASWIIRTSRSRTMAASSS